MQREIDNRELCRAGAECEDPSRGSAMRINRLPPLRRAVVLLALSRSDSSEMNVVKQQMAMKR